MRSSTLRPDIWTTEMRPLWSGHGKLGRTISPKASFRSEVVSSAGSAIHVDPAHAISCPGAHQQYRICAATISVLVLRTLRSNDCIVIRRCRKILSIEHLEDVRRAIHSICLEPDTCRSPARNMSRCAMAEAGDVSGS